MKKTKFIPSALAGLMAVSTIAGTAMAATNSNAVIDDSRYGTINIHKLIENDGANKEAYGLADADESRIPVNDIGFDVAKIADIENVRGIVISRDGQINWDAEDGEVSVGTYYVDTDGLIEELGGLIGYVPKATYIKTDIVGTADVAPTIQYEYKDQKEASSLSTEQDAVNSAKAALDSARTDMNDANATAGSSASNMRDLQAQAALAQAAYDAAAAAASAAQTAVVNATTALTNANTAYTSASSSATEAQRALNDAQSDLDAATAAYSGSGSTATQTVLAQAQAALNDAIEEQNEAAKAAAEATAKQAAASEAYAQAQVAYAAAENIYQAASEAAARAANGDPDSIVGTADAVAQAEIQLENARIYMEGQDGNGGAKADSEAANAAATAASSRLSSANTALSNAEQALQTAIDNNADAYGDLETALAALKAAQEANAEAQDALARAQADQTNATTALTNANNAKTAADTAAQAAYDAARELQNQADTATSDYGADTTSGPTGQANAAYNMAVSNYIGAISDMDDAAEALGVRKVYTAEAIQEMMKQVIATLSEETINQFVLAHTSYDSTNNDIHGKYTDDQGTATFSGLELGLYLVAETDISAHDGIAGAWYDGLDPNDNSINNDQQNHFDGTNYIISPLDGHGQESEHSYQAGEAYRESVNPEFPVLDSKAAPFLVSVPTTNMADTTVNDVAAGDNYGAAGTVWQYTVDVYPKNQTTGIYKRILDPDEAAGTEIFRTSEDFQIGDTINQVIWAEAPILQPNYLDDDTTNMRLGYVISDTMTDGLVFQGVSKVTVIPSSKLKGENDNTVTYLYFDPYGAECSPEEALVDPQNPDSALKTITKYYDIEGHEISQEVYEAASANNVTRDAMHTKTLSYKKFAASGARYNAGPALQASALAGDDAIVLEAGVDYTVVNTKNQSVDLRDANGNTATVAERGNNGFAVVLTQAGLAKLDGREGDSIVCVYFDSILSDDALIGQAGAGNMNCAQLSWVNSNTAIKSIRSNEVYDYSYELIIKKEGVTDASNVKFIVSRDDTNDFLQSADKDLTDTVSGVTSLGQDDSIRFVKEADGIYHVWGYATGENSSASDAANAFETSEINGITYNTVTPAPDGTLKLKGLDSNTYIFKEIQTEQGKNLLKDPFSVELIAADSSEDDGTVYDSLRDGRLLQAFVSTGDNDPIDITIGAIGTTGTDAGANNLGIASMAVNNYNVVDLRTGGEGRTLIYVIGGALLAAIGVGLVATGKKKKANN